MPNYNRNKHDVELSDYNENGTRVSKDEINVAIKDNEGEVIIRKTVKRERFYSSDLRDKTINELLCH